MAGKSSSVSVRGRSQVVIKAVVDRRTEGQLHALEQPHHRPGHHMGARMPHDPQGLGIFFGQQPQRHFAVARQRRDGIDRLAIDFGRHGGLGQAGADIGRDVDRPNRFVYSRTLPSGSLTLSMREFLGENRKTCRRDNLQIYG